MPHAPRQVPLLVSASVRVRNAKGKQECSTLTCLPADAQESGQLLGEAPRHARRFEWPLQPATLEINRTRAIPSHWQLLLAIDPSASICLVKACPLRVDGAELISLLCSRCHLGHHHRYVCGARLSSFPCPVMVRLIT